MICVLIALLYYCYCKRKYFLQTNIQLKFFTGSIYFFVCELYHILPYIMCKIIPCSDAWYFGKPITLWRSKFVATTGVIIIPQPDREGNKLGSMSETRAISTTSRRELPSSFIFSCKARRRRKFTPSWQKHSLVSFLVGLSNYQRPCTLRTAGETKGDVDTLFARN